MTIQCIVYDRDLVEIGRARHDDLYTLRSVQQVVSMDRNISPETRRCFDEYVARGALLPGEGTMGFARIHDDPGWQDK
jgi:hypothetical protein